MSKWAEDSFALPGEFTGHTGARVLSEVGLFFYLSLIY
jgi:hypothetical protein